MTSLYPLSPSSSYPHNSSKIRNKIRSPPPTIKSPYPDLPSDPKRWTSSHVSTYLTHCLRLYPSAIVSDLSKYVKEDSTLTGKKFLRLKEDQLRQMNFNEKWIKLIMVGIKVLRREHLKGKILLNGVDNNEEEPDEMMKIIQGSSEESGDERYSSSSSRKSSFERNSSISSSSTTSSNNNDLKNFFIPTTFSNLTTDDKEFIIQEFNKLKEFLKTDIENKNHDKKFNELNRFIEKALLNIEMNKEKEKNDDDYDGGNDGNDGNDNGNDDGKIVEVRNENENENSKSSLISLILFNWLNNKWTTTNNNNNNKIFESGFVRGVMIGGVAVWMCMRYYKW